MEPAHIFAPGHTWPDVVLRAIEALIVIVPVLLSWDNRRRHREAILSRDLSPDQLRALAAPKPMPTPGATAGLVILILLGIGMVAHLAREHTSGVAGVPGACSPATCKPPARCTADGCTDVAAPHGEVAGDPPWASDRGAWDGRAPWLRSGS